MTPTLNHNSHPKGLPAPYEYAEHLEKHHPDPEPDRGSLVAGFVVCCFIGALAGIVYALAF